MDRNKKRTRKISIKGVIGGQFLTEDFVSRQLKLLVLIVALTVVFISNSYSCVKKLAEIEALNAKLKEIKYEHLDLSAQLTSSSRYSKVEDLLKQRGINLSSPANRVYEIKK